MYVTYVNTAELAPYPTFLHQLSFTADLLAILVGEQMTNFYNGKDQHCIIIRHL